MLDATTLIDIFHRNNVGFFAGVPDSLLKPFCLCLNETVPNNRHIVAANEGAAIALAAGYYLATGAMGCVYMQNSGLGNASNPLISLLDRDVYAIPALLLIGWRGEMRQGAQIHDEPQHAKQGRITLALLDCLEVPYAILDPGADVETTVNLLTRRAMLECRPVALVARRDTFSAAEGQVAPASIYTLTREQGLRCVIDALAEETVFVSTTGKVSRELYEMRIESGVDPKRDFLTVGSMGHALQIASGIALARPDKTVACIDGDGALFMHMGGMVTSADAPNLLHIVMNNGAHESAGGSPTKGFSVDMVGIARACGYRSATRAVDASQIEAAIDKALAITGSAFVEIRTCLHARDNLVRPQETAQASKLAFMRSINGHLA
jgi:phosphonopyruvate decarboxylase